MPGLIYLASPYSAGGAPPEILHERFEEVSYWAALCLAAGFNVISPIAHSHPISTQAPDLMPPGNWEAWQRIDFAILDRCDALWLCNLPNWNRSIGVRDELIRASRQGKPCHMLNGFTNGSPNLLEIAPSALAYLRDSPQDSPLPKKWYKCDPDHGQP